MRAILCFSCHFIISFSRGCFRPTALCLCRERDRDYLSHHCTSFYMRKLMHMSCIFTGFLPYSYRHRCHHHRQHQHPYHRRRHCVRGSKREQCQHAIIIGWLIRQRSRESNDLKKNRQDSKQIYKQTTQTIQKNAVKRITTTI